jgi:molybdopterin-guanine dinucleotide biosynthesis protein A
MRIFEPSRVNACGYILAGGVSSRFGQDKALAELSGMSMIERMHRVLQSIYLPGVWVVGDPRKYSQFGIPCIQDRWPGEGPLGGILTALRHSQEYEWPRTALLQKDRTPAKNFIVGCDMPFLNKEWMEELLIRTRETGADVVVPKSAFGLEPLCACWRTSVAEKIQAAFDEGVRKVTEAMARLRVEVLDETHWKRFDSGGRLFWNMNTRAEYDEARRILEAEESSGRTTAAS